MTDSRMTPEREAEVRARIRDRSEVLHTDEVMLRDVLRELDALRAERDRQRAEETELLGASEAARRLNCHPNSLRLWDDLLRPLRDSSGKRLFPADAVERLARQRLGVQS